METSSTINTSHGNITRENPRDDRRSAASSVWIWSGSKEGHTCPISAWRADAPSCVKLVTKIFLVLCHRFTMCASKYVLPPPPMAPIYTPDFDSKAAPARSTVVSIGSSPTSSVCHARSGHTSHASFLTSSTDRPRRLAEATSASSLSNNLSAKFLENARHGCIRYPLGVTISTVLFT